MLLPVILTTSLALIGGKGAVPNPLDYHNEKGAPPITPHLNKPFHNSILVSHIPVLKSIVHKYVCINRHAYVYVCMCMCVEFMECEPYSCKYMLDGVFLVWPGRLIYCVRSVMYC